MIVEERIYKIRTGKMARYLELVREEGLTIQQPILGNLIGYFQVEIGELSHVVHMWGYTDLNDRAERRKKARRRSAVAGIQRPVEREHRDSGKSHPRSDRLFAATVAARDHQAYYRPKLCNGSGACV